MRYQRFVEISCSFPIVFKGFVPCLKLQFPFGIYALLYSFMILVLTNSDKSKRKKLKKT